jgi:hypothetical protein
MSAQFQRHQPQSHFLSDLLIRLFGSFAVFDPVNLSFIPCMRAQNDLRRLAAFFDFFACARDTGGFRSDPGFARS